MYRSRQNYSGFTAILWRAEFSLFPWTPVPDMQNDGKYTLLSLIRWESWSMGMLNNLPQITAISQYGLLIPRTFWTDLCWLLLKQIGAFRGEEEEAYALDLVYVFFKSGGIVALKYVSSQDALLFSPWVTLSRGHELQPESAANVSCQSWLC